MKKRNLIIAIICLTTTYGFGQDYYDRPLDNDFRESIHFGAKVGTNYSNVYDTEGEKFDADPKFGLATGVFLFIPIGMYLGIQPELLFSQKGFKAEGELFGNTYVLKRTSNYIDIPLLVSINPIEYLSILAGPQYSYLISQTNKFENSETSIEQEKAFDNDNLRKNTLCFTGGLDVKINPLLIGGRVGWDLFKNNGDGTTTTPRYKNVWYQLTFGFQF